MWEFGPAVNKEGHRLVITPESAHHLRPLVNRIGQEILDKWIGEIEVKGFNKSAGIFARIE